jgi:hypothetical protein
VYRCAAAVCLWGEENFGAAVHTSHMQKRCAECSHN